MSLFFFPLWRLTAKGSYQPSQHRLGASRVNSIWARAMSAPWLVSAGGWCSHLVHEERPVHLVFGDLLLWPVVSATCPHSLGSCNSGLSLPEQSSSRWMLVPSRPTLPRSVQGALLRPWGTGGISQTFHQQVPSSWLRSTPSHAAHPGGQALPRWSLMLFSHSTDSAGISALIPSLAETPGGWGPRSRWYPHLSTFSSLPLPLCLTNFLFKSILCMKPSLSASLQFLSISSLSSTHIFPFALQAICIITETGALLPEK